jgi:glycerol-3-phosphate acyltransferase PlsY
MELLPASGIALAAGYLVGSIPFSWIAVKARTGQDLRTVGSGNAGATNASRVLGKGWFLPLFGLDAGKGAVTVALAGVFAAQVLGSGLSELELLTDVNWIRVAAATGAILGHILCPWLGFKGGKAVATGAGALAVMSPHAALAGVVGFAVGAGTTWTVSMGSIAAALFAEGWEFMLRDGTSENEPRKLFVMLLCIVVIVKHIPNLRRIAAGTEPRIGERK